MSPSPLCQHASNVQDSAYKVKDIFSSWYVASDGPWVTRGRSQSDRSTDITCNEEQSRQQNHISKNEKPPIDSYRCSTCHKEVRTKSELKKHYLRHTKPFHCSNASCARTEGFGTVSDLNRHVQNKHPDASTEIPKTYQCQVAGCKSKDKTWPRLDNFKSHLKRMHRLPDEEINAMVALTPPPLTMAILQALQEESRYSDNLPESQCLEPNIIKGEPESPAQLLKNTDPIQKGQNGVISDENGAESSAKAVGDGTPRLLLQILNDAGYRLVRDDSPERGRERERTVNVKKREKREPVGCTQCRFIGRPCELKKHMKRHTRPYGCTFPKCQKVFGSKNDWKRHETSQHYQLEIWRCDGEINGHTCTEAFFSAEIFRAHLGKAHDLSDQEIDSKIVAPRSRVFNSQAHFWCGFCERIVELHQAGVDTWTERFNHIDDHFMGRHGTTKQSISEWLDPDRDDNSKTSAFGREPDHSQSRRKLVDFPAGSSSVTSFSMSDCTGQTISEVGIDWDGSKNSDTRVYYNMYNMIKGQQEEDVAKMQNARSGLGGYPTQEVVVGKLMRELPSIFNKEWAAKIEIQGENRPTAPTDSVREKRSTEYSDELDQENANSRAPKRLKTGSVRAADDDIRLRLACPFRKHDPRKYTIQSYRSCALSSWYSIARVKEHIYRRHRQPIQCKRCWKLVKDQDELDAHLRADNICEIEPGRPADGLSATDVVRLKSRKKTSPDQSEEERWEGIYSMLFPGEPIPTPNFGQRRVGFDQVRDDLASSPSSRDLAYYEEYSRRELPNFFRRWLEVAVSKETRIDYLRRDLIAIVRKFQDRAFSAWQPKKPPLKITQGTLDTNTNLEMPQGQTSTAMSHSQGNNLHNALEASTVIRHPASFELNMPVENDMHTLFGSGFPSAQAKPSALLDTTSTETGTSRHCLGPCICLKTPKENLAIKKADPPGEVAEDRPNDEWPTQEFGNFDLPTPAGFLDSDVDWEAMFMEMS